MRTRILVGLTMVVALVMACGAPKPPELVTRGNTVVGPPERDGGGQDYTHADDDLDAGLVPVDAGPCCPVRFALSQHAGEVQGDLQFIGHQGNFPLTADDAGTWSVDLCMYLVPEQYYFAMGYDTGDPDAGLFPWNRVNDAVPTALNAVVDEVNVFDPGAALQCAELDAGVYASLPDAGP